MKKIPKRLPEIIIETHDGNELWVFVKKEDYKYMMIYSVDILGIWYYINIPEYKYDFMEHELNSSRCKHMSQKAFVKKYFLELLSVNK